MARTRRPENAKRYEQAAQLLAGGASQTVTARLIGSNFIAHAVRIELGLPTRPGRSENKKRNGLILESIRSGLTYKATAKRFKTSESHVTAVVKKAGGMPPPIAQRSSYRLSFEEREEISRGLVGHRSFREIARGLKRPPSTVSREVKANGGREYYRAALAERRRNECAKRPKAAKLATNTWLHDVVQERLLKKHSPRQIALCLMNEFPDQADRNVSHETIYQSLFIQGRGALKRELTACLRTGRALRKSQRRETKAGRIKDMVMIADRPAAVEDRAIPGHWEGDLIVGKNGKSAIGTLVERQTRYVMLMKLSNQKAETVRKALTATVARLPQELFKSITWDQGKEMAEHAIFSVESGVEVFFCDPHSPWQRGSNENTNGLLRQYFPKATSLSGFSQDELDAVARELNERPRETLNLKTPAQMLDQLLR